MFVLLILSITLIGCEVISTLDDTKDDPINTTTQQEEPKINKFAQEIEKSNEYSYKIVYKSVKKATNEEDTFTYKYAKSGKDSAFSMANEEDETIFLIKENYMYLIYINEEGKSATKVKNDGSYEENDPDFSFLTEFNSSYQFEKKTDNVMVGTIKTTVYEYSLFGVKYKYYVNTDGYVIKVEFEDQDERFIMEILDFKTSNIDRTILKEPTEADGYVITDLTNFE